jgi:hypothetical protein
VTLSAETGWEGGCTVSKEIESLNAPSLDVVELERRLELASALPTADCWVNACVINTG